MEEVVVGPKEVLGDAWVEDGDGQLVAGPRVVLVVGHELGCLLGAGPRMAGPRKAASPCRGVGVGGGERERSGGGFEGLVGSALDVGDGVWCAFERTGPISVRKGLGTAMGKA